MAELGSSVMLNAARHNQVFEGFRHHSSAPRVSSELVILDLLRKTHPDYHVTSTAPSCCDYIGFASAGHASAVKDADDELFDSTRIYSAPGPGKENDPGSLRDIVRFGRWKYSWNGYQFIVYEVETSEARSKKALFFLSPRTDLPTEAGLSPSDELLIAIGAWSAVLHDEIYVFDDGYWAKSRELFESIKDSSWEDVILNPDVKSNLIQDVQGFFDSKALYKKLRVPWKRGLILHGVPGNGKTISIKALISELYARAEPIPSLYVKSFDARNGRNNSIRSIFTLARQMAPCLLIFEDLDSLVTETTRSYFLNEVDGLESNDGILMIGSTNHLDSLDPAISKRPSRFDRKYHFRLPDEEERIAYARYWRNKLEGSEMVDFPTELCAVLGKVTDGFSFAYLKELFVIALLTIARGGTGDVETAEAEIPVMVKHADADSNSSKSEEDNNNNNPETITETQTGVPPPKKRTIPDVEIPTSLQDNLLLKVIKAHLKTLLEEMDNTKEGNWPSAKTQAGGVPGRTQMPTIMQAAPIITHNITRNVAARRMPY